VLSALWCVHDGTVSEAVVVVSYHVGDNALEVIRSMRTVVKLEPCVVN